MTPSHAVSTVGEVCALAASQSKPMLDRLIKQMAEQEGVTEQLKADGQMAWVGAMNNIKARAEEIVGRELIYISIMNGLCP